jgi:hypothetical protein
VTSLSLKYYALKMIKFILRSIAVTAQSHLWIMKQNIPILEYKLTEKIEINKEFWKKN